MNKEGLKEKALDDLQGALIEAREMLKPGRTARDILTNMLGQLKNIENKDRLYEILKHAYSKEGKPNKKVSSQILEYYVVSVNRIRGNFIEFLNDDVAEEDLINPAVDKE